MKKLLCTIAALSAIGTANATAITYEYTGRGLNAGMADNALPPPAAADQGIVEYLFDSEEARLYGQVGEAAIWFPPVVKPGYAAIIASGLALLALAPRRQRRKPA